MQVQALAETAAIAGGGRIWLAVTAHGDIQALQQNVQQEHYAKIIQRFPASLRCKLSNEDISQVVEERLLRKTQPARIALEERFNERSGDLADLGTVRGAQRVYPVPDASRFALFYPYLPWTVAAIPDVVKGIALATGRDEALTGSNRTMIGVVQGAIIETPGLLESPVGRLLALADLYDQLSSDVAIETKTDLNRIGESVPRRDPLHGARRPRSLPARPGQVHPDDDRQRRARGGRLARCQPGRPGSAGQARAGASCRRRLRQAGGRAVRLPQHAAARLPGQGPRRTGAPAEPELRADPGACETTKARRRCASTVCPLAAGRFRARDAAQAGDRRPHCPQPHSPRGRARLQPAAARARSASRR